MSEVEVRWRCKQCGHVAQRGLVRQRHQFGKKLINCPERDGWIATAIPVERRRRERRREA